MEVCDCYLGRQKIGAVHWQNDGPRLTVQVSCPFEEGVLYRALLYTGLDMIPLGVMLPRQGQFVLQKQLYLQAKPVSVHIDRTLPGECHLQGLPLGLSAFIQDEDGLMHGCWLNTELLLFPLQTGESCLWAHLLCLASIVEQEGKLYAVLCAKEDRYVPLSDMLRSGDMIW